LYRKFFPTIPALYIVIHISVTSRERLQVHECMNIERIFRWFPGPLTIATADFEIQRLKCSDLLNSSLCLSIRHTKGG